MWPEKVNWHIDVNSGKQWNVKFYKMLKPLSTPNDIYEKKNPWDLSRLQFLFTLYRAYVLTNDYKYIKKIIYFLEDWLRNNPPFYGVNWMNAMEVGIRASNLVLIISYLSDHFSDELLKKLEKSLLFHLSPISKLHVQISGLKKSIKMSVHSTLLLSLSLLQYIT